MVLLVLALIWGALLVSWLKSRSESTFSDSVGTFRRHLTVLERATPTTVRPANRLRDGYSGAAQYRSSARGQLQAGRPTPARHPAPGRSAGAAARPTGARSGRPIAGNAAALRRRQAQKRRRDVFFALLAGAAGSFLLALIPGLSIMWAVQVICDVLLAGYVAMLVRIRNLAAERELKLRFIPNARPAARSSRSYDFGAAGYGELELRRAAN